MALTVDIRKQLGSFRLEAQFETDGKPLALLGASGSGKSVTLRCIAGILTPDEGVITLDGETLFDSSRHISLPPQRRRIGYLFQQYALFPNMTVAQNIAAALPRTDARTGVLPELLRRFRLEEVAGQKPWQLSGGQQQRTSLARIFASRPRAILLDEPLSALDPLLRSQVELELMELLDDFPGTLLWVSHDRGEVFRNCPHVCVMEQGRSQPVCSMKTLLRRPPTEAAARLAGCQTFTDVTSREEGLFFPAWGVTLACQPSPGIHRAGIPAHAVHPAAPDQPGGIPCRLLRVIEDTDATLLLLRPEGAAPAAPPLRMACPPETHLTAPALTVSLVPEELFLFS